MLRLTSTTTILLHSFTIQENGYKSEIFKNTLILNKKVPFLFNTTIELHKIGYSRKVPLTWPQKHQLMHSRSFASLRMTPCGKLQKNPLFKQKITG